MPAGREDRSCLLCIKASEAHIFKGFLLVSCQAGTVQSCAHPSNSPKWENPARVQTYQATNFA